MPGKHKKAYSVTMADSGEVTKDTLEEAFKSLEKGTKGGKDVEVSRDNHISKKEKVKLSQVLNSDAKENEIVNLDKAGLKKYQRKCKREGVDFFVMRNKKDKTITVVAVSDNSNTLGKGLRKILDDRNQEKAEKRLPLKERIEIAQKRREEKNKDKVLDKIKNKSKEDREL